MSEELKAIISNRIYFKVKDVNHLKQLVDTLTYRIESKSSLKSKIKHIETIKNYKMLPNNIISIPQGRIDLIPEDYTIVDKRVTYDAPFPLPKFSLREGQQEVFDKVDDTCFINALVGWGRFCPTLK